ncbi:MAG: hypothetical protein ACT4QD_25580 [Acidobacteriota bacterium]
MIRLLCTAVMLALTTPLMAQDKSAEVMAEMRKALGGDKLTQVKTLTLEGPFARDMGARQMAGTLVLTLQTPDRMHRSEDMEMPGGLSIERISALNGDKTWEDMQNRGGLGPGMQVVLRTGPPGQELNPEQLEQARLRRTRSEFNRYLLAFFGGGSLQPTHVAVAESPDGKADVLEIKNDAGQATRLFVDQQTHLPLMLQYSEVRPRMNVMGGPRGGGPGMRGGGGAVDGVVVGGGDRPGGGGRPAAGGQRPNPDEVRRRMESMPPPEPSLVSLYVGDFKKVDGVMLPHRLTQAVDGRTIEEWTIEKVKVNPSVKADLFDKK